MKTLFLVLLFSSQLSGWELLSTVEVKRGFDDYMGSEVDIPAFSEALRANEGLQVVLDGYIIPFQSADDQDYFVLSRFPYQSCFFCGAAGPETVVEIYLEEQFQFTDERVRVEGSLRLNEDNPLHLFFILENCTATLID